MERIQLKAEPRTQTGKGVARAARRAGKIPGVCYGKAIEPFSMTLEPGELQAILHSRMGRNSIISLDVDGTVHNVMVVETQRDPVKRHLLHVDFRVVNDEDIVIINVPVRPLGTSAGQKIGGRLELARRAAGIRCAVKNIPEFIDYDITEMELGETLLASGLTAPENCELYFKSDYLVLRIAIPRGADEDEVEEGEEGDEEVEEAPAAAAEE